MGYPGIFKNLFDNEGRGPLLREDIIPDKAYSVTARKLDTEGEQVGSDVRPVYFDETGAVKACAHDLRADVPADAKFTDTNTKVLQLEDSNDASDVPVLLKNDLGYASYSDAVTVTPNAGTVKAKTFASPLMAGNYLAANRGSAVVNSEGTPGEHVAMMRYPGALGVFTVTGVGSSMHLTYTDNATVEAARNQVGSDVVLLDHNGNTSFPGTVTGSFKGAFSGRLYGTVQGESTESYVATGNLKGNADTATKAGSLSVDAQVGDQALGVWINDEGTPVACSYRVYKDVPSNAEFTDQLVRCELDTRRRIYLSGCEGAATAKQYFDSSVFVSEVPGELHAAKFVGTLQGDITGSCLGSSGSCTGNSVTASSLAVPRVIKLSGDATGEVLFSGATNVEMDVYIDEATPKPHASTHFSTGSDPILPTDIGALPSSGGVLTGTVRTRGVNGTAVRMSGNVINLGAGDAFCKTVTEDTALSISGAEAGRYREFALFLENGGSGNVVTWFDGIRWSGSSVPTLSDGGMDVFKFYTYDGATWFGSHAVSNA